MQSQTGSLREELFYETPEADGDTANRTSVFPTQCLVLGDRRVGKSSLVKSLTGKVYDPTEKRTEGIEQSLVDHKWKNCDMKDLIFGDAWRFIVEGLVGVALTRIVGRKREVLIKKEFIIGNDILWMRLFLCGVLITYHFLAGIPSKYPVAYLLFYGIYFGYLMIPFCAIHISNIRFILAPLVFILNHRGLLIGYYSALIACLYYNSYFDFASTPEFLTLSIVTITIIIVVTMLLFISPLQLPFGTDQLVRRHGLKLLCCCRLPLSIFIGLIYGLIVSMLFCVWYGIHAQEFKLLVNATEISLATMTPSMTKDHNHFKKLFNCVSSADVNKVIVSFLGIFLLDFPFQVVGRTTVSHLFTAAASRDKSLRPYIALCLVFLYYHLRIILYERTHPRLTVFYFFPFFFLYFSLTLFEEWFPTHISNFERIRVDEHTSTSFFSLVLFGFGMINKTMLRTALKDKYSSLKLKILDFAGDKEYYAYHHMFLRSQAVYLIVFNMTDFTEEDLANVGTQRLRFWFESVCSHILPKTPICLVGTHSESMDRNHLHILNDQFKQTLWPSYCDELIVNEDEDLIYFPVENTKGENDVGVQKLRLKIMAAAEECKPFTDHNIPLSWIRIQDAIIQLRQKKAARFCVTLKEFPWAFGYYIHTNWSEETLKYFHEQGLVIYLHKDEDLSNWVLLKPEILVDIIIQLVKPSPQTTQPRGLRSDWKLLQEKGMLTKSLLVTIISNVQENEAAMRAFLEEYDLICPLTNPKVKIASLRDKERLQPTHFVPSLLPKSQDGFIPAWHDDVRDKKFLVFFERFLPEPLFHRLLSRAHKNSMVEFTNGATVVFRDVGKFWMSPWQPYRLKLIKKENVIEVTFSTSNRRGKKPSDVLCQVYSMVDGICKRSFPFIKFHCGPTCPSTECPGYQDNYMYTPYHHYRRHVFNIMPGRQVDKTASLYCVNRSFEDELQDWIP